MANSSTYVNLMSIPNITFQSRYVKNDAILKVMPIIFVVAWKGIEITCQWYFQCNRNKHNIVDDDKLLNASWETHRWDQLIERIQVCIKCKSMNHNSLLSLHHNRSYNILGPFSFPCPQIDKKIKTLNFSFKKKYLVFSTGERSFDILIY